MTQEELKSLYDYAEAQKYENKETELFMSVVISFRGKDYCGDVTIQKSELEEMTFNDALLCLIDRKIDAERYVSYLARDTLMSVNDFVAQFDCPTCPK